MLDLMSSLRVMRQNGTANSKHKSMAVFKLTYDRLVSVGGGDPKNLRCLLK